MAKGIEIKRRIKSIKSILQMTKAMEMVSSIKMRKAKDKAVRSKNYVFESWRSALKLSTLPENKNAIFFKEQENKKILALVISSDKGLCGSYNSDVMREILKFVKEEGVENIDFVTLGAKGREFIRKIGGNIVADFPLYENIRFSMASPIGLVGWDGFMNNKYGKYISIHTHFESVVSKGVTRLQILPLQRAVTDEQVDDQNGTEYAFEPSRQEVLTEIAKQIVRALTYQVILESEASEHASRMVAMKNASDSGEELKEDFEFTYNQLRQQSITQELAEISAGVNSMQ